MTSQDAMKKANEMRRTQLNPVVSESHHGAGAKGDAFSMYSISMDGVTIAGEHSFEDCFKRLERDLDEKRATHLERLRSELAALEGPQGVA